MALEHATAPNGLNIYVDPIESFRKVNVDVLFKAGSIQEDPEEAGLAHAVEHSVHLSTDQFEDRRALDIYRDINSIKANAETTFHYTRYLGRGPRLIPILNQLNQVLFHPKFEDERITREMEVIEKESRQGRDNTRLMHTFASRFALFGEPYARKVIGHSGKLQFRPDQVRDFHSEHYHLGNMAIVLVGKTSTEEAVDYVSTFFGENIPDGEQSRPRPLHALPTEDIGSGLLIPNAKSAYLTQTAAFTPEFFIEFDENREAFKAAGMAISARLFNILRREHGITYAASFNINTNNHVEAWSMGNNVITSADKLELAESVLNDVFQQSETEYSNDDIDSSLGKYKGNVMSVMDSIDQRSGHYLSQIAANTEPEDVTDLEDKVESLTRRDVRSGIDKLTSFFNSRPKVTHVTGTKEAIEGCDKLIDLDDFS